MSNSKRIQVLLPQALPTVLDYSAEGFDVAEGQFVTVPLGNKVRFGVVWSVSERGNLPTKKLKSILSVLDVPPLSAEHRDFISLVAKYTLSLEGNILKMSMPVVAALLPPPVQTLYYYGGTPPAKITTDREALLGRLIDQIPRSVVDLALLGQVGEGVVRGLIKCGTLLPISIARDKPYEMPKCHGNAPNLLVEQAKAATHIIEAKKSGKFNPILLDGVTGAGKTEVYFEAIIDILENSDQQVLVLLPEIALTSQWLERFEERFGCAPVLWHSDVGTAERRRAWRAVADGGARLVVGARSSLFLPFKNLGLIIVDEEHDPSYKQEEGVIYNARDMAVLRAKGLDIPIVLASATPSFETLFNANEHKYSHVELKERHGTAGLPDIETIDLRAQPPPSGRFISPPLENAINQALERGEQVMLFLNRRGYAPLTLCRHCGDRVNCPNCSAWLVEHRYRNSLECHHCGHTVAKPNKCPTCGQEDSLAACGPGVERIEEEVQALFPTAKHLVMTSDTVTTPSVGVDFVRQIQSGSVDIIIGTQIISKGYHFPKLTVVGVVDADLGLKGADLRAAERTFSQLAQVAGRAGREEKQGRVLLQTYMPDHPVAIALRDGDVAAFRSLEFKAREQAHMPPYGRMAAIILSGANEREVLKVARELSLLAPRYENVTVLGPAPAPLARLRGQFRYRFLLMTPKELFPQKLIRSWLSGLKKNSKVRVKVDIDPQSFN
jgi:primosomal protein N' (replication factor Y)